jgi:hypothetical protein
MSSRRMFTPPRRSSYARKYSSERTFLADNGYSYDKIHNIRRDMVDALKKEFLDYGLT